MDTSSFSGDFTVRYFFLKVSGPNEQNCLVMVYPCWLLFSGVWLLNIATDANGRVEIVATFTHNSDLVKCHSCLTEIAGLDRLSLAPPPKNGPDKLSTSAQFHASGHAYSFIRAKLDCQSDLTCGFITMAGSEHANIVENRNIPAKTVKQSLCLLTYVQTSFDCGVCLKMKIRSHSMQKFQLVTMKRQ